MEYSARKIKVIGRCSIFKVKGLIIVFNNIKNVKYNKDFLYLIPSILVSSIFTFCLLFISFSGVDILFGNSFLYYPILFVLLVYLLFIGTLFMDKSLYVFTSLTKKFFISNPILHNK